MAGRHQPQVLIAGAGPVGLFAALWLARAGVNVQVVDVERTTATNSYALALHPRSLALLDQVGLAHEVLQQGLSVRALAFYQGGERRVELPFSALPGAFPQVLVLPQSALEELLVSALAKHHVPVLWNHRLAGLETNAAGAELRIDRLEKCSTGYAYAGTEWVIQKTIPARVEYVVGADGHHSFVRRNLGIEYRERGPSSLFAIFEFAVDAPVPPEVRVVLDERTTSVLWPLPGGRCRWSFEIADPGLLLERREKNRLAVQIDGRSYPHLEESHLHELLRQRAPWFSGSFSDVRWSFLVRFERRLALAYGRDRAWLVGDAAHMTGPVGVQSMNVGLREAADLGEAILAALGGASAPDAFETYGRRFLAEWRVLLGLGDDPGPVPADPWLASQRTRILSCIPASGVELVQLLERGKGIPVG
jgi:2-polyprenyl-6-methoxyphenol hydroxylase-like FAD-dependent oxidoreductase